MRTRPLVAVVLTGSLLAGACGNDEPPVGVEAVQAAFDEAARHEQYRVEQSSAQQINVAGLGLSINTRIEPEQPQLVANVTPDGAQVVMDISRLFDIEPGDPAVVAFVWELDGEIIVDSRDSAQVASANPDRDLGPLAPGVSSIDTTVADVAVSDLAEALVGAGTIDLSELAVALPPLLDDLQLEPVAGTVYTATLAYDEFLDVVSGDSARTARAAAEGLALTVPVDPAALAKTYLEAYSDTQTRVAIEIEGGKVRVLSFRTDLTAMFNQLFITSAFADLGLSMREVRETEELFRGGSWVLNSRIEFIPENDLRIDPALPADEDRTEAWVAFLDSAG